MEVSYRMTAKTGLTGKSGAIIIQKIRQTDLSRIEIDRPNK